MPHQEAQCYNQRSFTSTVQISVQKQKRYIHRGFQKHFTRRIWACFCLYELEIAIKCAHVIRFGMNASAPHSQLATERDNFLF